MTGTRRRGLKPAGPTARFVKKLVRKDSSLYRSAFGFYWWWRKKSNALLSKAIPGRR